MKRWFLPLSLVLLLIGGCNQDLQDADPKDLPDTIAMQDEFTREFMASAEEEEEEVKQLMKSIEFTEKD